MFSKVACRLTGFVEVVVVVVEERKEAILVIILYFDLNDFRKQASPPCTNGL